MGITPLEEAIFNAQEVAAGLAATAIIQDLIRQSDVATAQVRDKASSLSDRKKALRDSRNINLMLNIIAEQRSMIGIEA